MRTVDVLVEPLACALRRVHHTAWQASEGPFFSTLKIF